MIGITLKDFQERAVDYLFSKTTGGTSKSKITVQSPTGSGKTIILIAYIEKFLDYNKDTVFCWFCPGKGELEEQSKEKMVKYSPGLKTGDIFDIIKGGFEPGTSYFINWETITKKDNTAIKPSEKKNLFEKIREAHNRNTNFIVIIDEEHQNNTAKADDIINSINGKYEIRVSATPNRRAAGAFYEISEVDVINEGLITRFMYINTKLDNININDIKHEADILLEKAQAIRHAIHIEYMNEEEDVNPLVLVQFPNLNDELIEHVEKKLDSMGINYDNNKLASWFSAETKADRDKKSKKLGKINIGTTKEDSITNNNAAPTFLLFKQALATGWDCPRAKILVKLRENMSETFEIQTLGRLRRMPNAHHYGKDILDCSFLYTFDEKYKQEVIDAGNGFETQRVFLKEEAKSISLFKEMKNKDGDYIDERSIRERIYNFFREEYNLDSTHKENKKKLETQGYKIGQFIEKTFHTGKVATLKEINDESLNTGDISIKVNTHVHGMDLRHNVDAIKKHVGLSYDKTSNILRTLFLNKHGNRNYKLLNLNLIEYYAFVINNTALLKEKFIEFSGQRYDQLKILDNKSVEFKIPIEEHYRYMPNEKTIKVLQKNVYKEYNTSMITSALRSKSERLFEKYCEKNKKVKFVYKNGDCGQQYLSIIYTTNCGKERTFYPDYIVQLLDGSIWLIETKGGELQGVSQNIDIQVENKFEAFKNFAKKYKYNFGFVRNKDEDLYINNTEYVDNMNDTRWVEIEEIF